MSDSYSLTKASNGCNGCRKEYRTTDAQIDRILAAPMFQSDELCVPDDVYVQRLDQCASCTKLMDGKTCLVCGCFVRVAAKYKARACPNPDERRWQAYGFNL